MSAGKLLAGPVFLAFVAAAASVVVIGVRRRKLPGWLLVVLLMMSTTAFAFGGLVTLSSPAAERDTFGCRSSPTDFVCTDAAEVAATLIMMLGTPLLVLSGLLLAWLPKRALVARRIFAAAFAVAAPLGPLWVVFSSPLFHVD